MASRAVRGVLLDVDGTLLLSNEIHARAWADALAEAGRPVDAQYILPLVGMGGDRVLPLLAPGLDDKREPGKSITERRKELILGRYTDDIRATPGARALVERLTADGYRLVVASSATEEELGVLLERAGVADLLPERTTSDDAESSKPAPDIVHVALERGGLEAEEAVLIGDTPYDIGTAHAAGVRVIALRCGGWDEGLTGAEEIYDDPADLLARYESSLLGTVAGA